MKATNLPMEDDRGIIALMINLFHAALVPSAREASTRQRPASRAGSSASTAGRQRRANATANATSPSRTTCSSSSAA